MWGRCDGRALAFYVVSELIGGALAGIAAKKVLKRNPFKDE